MIAHRVETVLSEDGVVTLRDVPFRRGVQHVRPKA
jgi:hypothetical protein